MPGGGRTTFDFNVRRWFGVSGSNEPGSFKLVTVNGRLLMIASHSHRYVCNDSSSNWPPFFSKIADDTAYSVNLAFPNSSHMACRRDIHFKCDPVTVVL